MSKRGNFNIRNNLECTHLQQTEHSNGNETLHVDQGCISDDDQEIDYSKYFNDADRQNYCTLNTICNLGDEDIRSYFDNVQEDSGSDIQDTFSDYELSVDENLYVNNTMQTTGMKL